MTAFKPPLAVSQGPTYFPFIDFQPTVNAFQVAFSGTRGDFFDAFLNSVFISIASTAFSVFFGSMAAYALVRFQFQVRLLSGLIFAVISIGGFLLLNGPLDLRAPTALGIVMVAALAVCVPVEQASDARSSTQERRCDFLVRFAAHVPAHCGCFRIVSSVCGNCEGRRSFV